MRIILCDNCGQRIMGARIVGADDGDYCALKCSISANGAEDACAHEDNISDEASGRDTARFICKACGYDRVEAVETIKV